MLEDEAQHLIRPIDRRPGIFDEALECLLAKEPRTQKRVPLTKTPLDIKGEKRHWNKSFGKNALTALEHILGTLPKPLSHIPSQPSHALYEFFGHHQTIFPYVYAYNLSRLFWNLDRYPKFEPIQLNPEIRGYLAEMAARKTVIDYRLPKIQAREGQQDAVFIPNFFTKRYAYTFDEQFFLPSREACDGMVGIIHADRGELELIEVYEVKSGGSSKAVQQLSTTIKGVSKSGVAISNGRKYAHLNVTVENPEEAGIILKSKSSKKGQAGSFLSLTRGKLDQLTDELIELHVASTKSARPS